MADIAKIRAWRLEQIRLDKEKARLQLLIDEELEVTASRPTKRKSLSSAQAVAIAKGALK